MNSKATIEATISAASQNMWPFWTKPEHITKWNSASEDWHCPKAANDLKVDGKYAARMEAKDGSYTMADEKKVTTAFENARRSNQSNNNF